MITRQQVVAAIAAALGADPGALDPDAGPGSVEGWDSLKSIHIVMALEELIGGRLDLDGLATATSIRDLTRLAMQTSAAQDECPGIRAAGE